MTASEKTVRIKNKKVAVEDAVSLVAAQQYHMTDEQIGVVYRLLENKTYMGAALEIGLDKWYKPSTIIQVMTKVVALVRREPERYRVTPEILAKVDYALSQRAISTKTRETQLEKNVAEENQSFKNILEDTRMGLLDILSRKVKRIGRSNKKIDEMNLGTLATTLAIIIDKTQLIRGEATENVAVLAKIDQNISPEAALDMVLKMRESNLEEKNNKK